MKLSEALRKVNERRFEGPAPWRCCLACGFTPLHFQTFLHAHLLERTVDRFTLHTGVFGDLVGNIERVGQLEAEKAVVAMEWSDVDARLGYRVTHGWRPGQLDDVLHTLSLGLHRIRQALEQVVARTTVCLSLPTLPLPPMFPEPPGREDPVALAAQREIQSFGMAVAELGVRVISAQRLAQQSPPASRHDIRADLASGFPYQLSHAATLADELARLLLPDVPKKGIITDLDDTLWRGLVGEDGVAGVTWDLDHHSHGHALYQEMLASLSELGVLIGVASKNDPDVAAQALARDDLVVPSSALFPIEVSWGPKSASIRNILAAWNVAADSVVFVDDSPLERAEVAAAFPDLECLAFPTHDDREILKLVQHLRSRCGKSSVTAEDRLRVASLRSSWHHRRDAAAVTSDDFLAQAKAELTIELDRPDQRSFDLVNKTNQFNLNGRRVDESAWRSRSEDPASFLFAVSYQDKFGPLGKVAVVGGRRHEETPVIDMWVMSCRAFSRRIEHQLLKVVFEQLQAETLEVDFCATERNGPMREFLATAAGAEPSGLVRLRKATFEKQRPALFGRVIVR